MANFAEKHEEHIKSLVAEGLTVSDIATRYSVSYGIVSNALRQLGLKAKRSHNRGSGTNDPKITKEELIRLYVDEDMTVGEIAQRKGTSRQTVYNTLERYGIPQRKKSKLNRVLDEDEVRKMLGSGMTAAAVAEAFGISPAALRTYAKEKGIPTRNARYASALTEENLRKWYIDEKKTMTEIANMVGCNYNTVSHACKKYGISKTRAEIHETMKATMRERYGVDYAMESPGIQQKMRYSRSPQFEEKKRVCEEVAPEMLRRGATISEIASELDCSYKKTRDMLVELGLFVGKENS